MLDFIINTLHYVISFIVIISVIVFVHEFGHYFVARICGVQVTDFSIGFGKTLISKTDKHGTKWKICAIPMGGYVKFLGDSDPASTDIKSQKISEHEKKFMFYFKPLPIKALIVAAGPLFNFIFSLIILTGFLYSNGILSSSTVVNKIQPDSPAQKAGLLPGDQILAINDSTTESFFEIERLVSMHPNVSLKFTIKRNNQNLNLNITPQPFSMKGFTNKEIIIGKIGVQSMGLEHKKLNLLESSVHASKEIINICKMTLKAIGQMFVGDRSYKEIEGPIGIAKLAGESTKRGFEFTLWLIALLSINLGFVNLLPIPLLDGGHLLFYVIETIAGKKIYLYIQKIAIIIGFIILISLTLLAIMNDITNIKLF
jgi:regulator of sigma E protease